jgi:hypothetical protein
MHPNQSRGVATYLLFTFALSNCHGPALVFAPTAMQKIDN